MTALPQNVPQDRRRPITLAEYEKIMPVCKLSLRGATLRFVTPNTQTAWRANSLLTKEPCTIEWLDSLGPDDVLFDVGANVGMYTVYAAALRGCRVHAFEPESQNFALLCRNVVANGLTERVTAWPVALSDAARLDRLHVSEFNVGGSCHSFGEPVDFRLQPARFPLTQGCVATTIDAVVAAGVAPAPTHVKLDVDGFEHRVVAGAAAAMPGIRSWIVETNPALAEHRAMVEALAAAGFRVDPAQVARATRAEGPFQGVAEHVFRR
jgi:FkbM family methyltransferase